MNCPRCHHAKTEVRSTPTINGVTRRYRECPQCRTRFVTAERVVANSLRISTAGHYPQACPRPKK